MAFNSIQKSPNHFQFLFPFHFMHLLSRQGGKFNRKKKIFLFFRTLKAKQAIAISNSGLSRATVPQITLVTSEFYCSPIPLSADFPFFFMKFFRLSVRQLLSCTCLPRFDHQKKTCILEKRKSFEAQVHSFPFSFSSVAKK